MSRVRIRKQHKSVKVEALRKEAYQDGFSQGQIIAHELNRTLLTQHNSPAAGYRYDWKSRQFAAEYNVEYDHRCILLHMVLHIATRGFNPRRWRCVMNMDCKNDIEQNSEVYVDRLVKMMQEAAMYNDMLVIYDAILRYHGKHSTVMRENYGVDANHANKIIISRCPILYELLKESGGLPESEAYGNIRHRQNEGTGVEETARQDNIISRLQTTGAFRVGGGGEDC